MKLTYVNGAFILIDKDGKERKLEIKSANRFRRYADKRARNVINRAFVKTYPLTVALPDFLDPHQKEGISWVLTRSRSYLAHAPGAGKTCQAIVAALLADGQGQTVFIVPPSLTVNWEREIMLWTAWAGIWPSITIVPETRKQDNAAWRADFIICPDSMLTKLWVLRALVKIKKKLVAVDEASRFKESTAQRTIALFGGRLKNGSSPGLIQDARHAVLLDGSPMPNRSMELWAPTIAMAPETIDFQSQEEFGFKYCGAKINDYGRWEFKHSSNDIELRNRLQRSYMHVVPEERLGHSERKRSILFMNEDARSPLHKGWERRHLKRINFNDIDEDMSQGDIARYRRELGERKIPWVARYISERLKSKNEAVLLFAWHREVVMRLSERLDCFPHGVVMGGTAEHFREKHFADFQAGKIKLLIMNIAAGGRGHNLQRADRVVFAEFSWSDETNKQCEKRASRKGRDKDLPVRCDYIVSPGSMDEPILEGVFRKAVSTKRVIG